jgi:hypothetical protein
MGNDQGHGRRRLGLGPQQPREVAEQAAQGRRPHGGAEEGSQ